MACSFVAAWQSCAFEALEYAKGSSYSAILSLLLETGGDNARYQLYLKNSKLLHNYTRARFYV